MPEDDTCLSVARGRTPRTDTAPDHSTPRMLESISVSLPATLALRRQLFTANSDLFESDSMKSVFLGAVRVAHASDDRTGISLGVIGNE
jgi:hypothetical protein